MKLLKIIGKNFKILLRSRASAFAVIVGPLLIISLIALAFSNIQEVSLSVGIITPDETELTSQFVQQLEVAQYNVQRFDTSDECVARMKLQETNMCIEFPNPFAIQNDETPVVKFFVDETRMNIVESILSSVKSTIFVKSDQISLELTEKLVETIDNTSLEVEQDVEFAANAKAHVEQANSANENVAAQSKTGVLDESPSSLSDAAKSASGIPEDLTVVEEKANALIKEVEDLVDELEAADSFPDERDAATQAKEDLELALTQQKEDINAAVKEIEDAISDVEKSINLAKGTFSDISLHSNQVQGATSQTQEQLDNIEKSLANIQAKISEISIISAGNIVKPFETQVTPIVSQANKSAYMLPYFIMLIILFIGIMLSSTLVVMEKTSRAFFRTFTTPTGDVIHVIANYITNSVVQTLQLALIFTGAYFYLKIPLFDNIGATLVVLFLSISMYIFIGELIGYLFKSQEGATIASISLGSLLLFLSNVILPIESFPAVIRKILGYNPYVLSSELLRKTILFNAPLSDLVTQLTAMIIYVVGIFILVLIVQRLSIERLFTGFSHRKVLKKPHFTKENYLRRENGELIKSKNDLVRHLRKMSDEEYEKFVTPKHNEFAYWLEKVFKEKKLAKLLRKVESRAKAIEVLEEFAKK